MKTKLREIIMAFLVIVVMFAVIMGIAVLVQILFNNVSIGQFLSINTETTEVVLPEPKPIIFRVTAYCPCEICCGKWADGITANGHVIQPGDKFVAAPADLFDFGDVIFVPGYGTVPVLDRGGSIKGKRIDVFFSTHQEALNWGVKHLTIGKAKK